MPDAIDIRDDGIHEHGGEPAWSERVSFAFFDPAAGTGGVARTEFHPGEGIAEGTLTIFVGDGAIATVLAREETPGGGASVGRIKLDRYEPLEKWRVRCKDIALAFSGSSVGAGGKRSGAAVQVDLDLTFEAWTRPVGSADRRKNVDDLGFVQVVSSGHFEQAGRFSGRMRVGGRATTMEGSGVRTRSWGARDRTAQHEETWYAAAFGPGLSFGLRIVALGDRRWRHGWVQRGDDLRSIATVHVEDDRQARARLVLADDAGDEVTVQAETLQAIPMREGGARIRQAMTRFLVDDRETIGLVEHLSTVPRRRAATAEHRPEA